MLKGISILIICTGVLFGLDWVKDIDTAFHLAKKENKSIMVFVESEHCRWCKKMKGRTLSDENVQKRLEHFILVKVMREDKNAMQYLPEVRGVPTIFFMDKEKRILEDILGYFDVLDFTSYIDDVERKMAK